MLLQWSCASYCGLYSEKILAVIKNLGGAVRGNSEGQAVQYQGWRIQANSGPITSKPKLPGKI